MFSQNFEELLHFSTQIDPKRIWKGVWRWYHEDMLACGIPLEHIKKSGLTLDQFTCLAACNSLEVSKHIV